MATPKVVVSNAEHFRSKCAGQEALKWAGQPYIPMSAKFYMSFAPENPPWVWTANVGTIINKQWNPQTKTLSATWDLTSLNGNPPKFGVTVITLGGVQLWKANLVQSWKRQLLTFSDVPEREYKGERVYWNCLLYTSRCV